MPARTQSFTPETWNLHSRPMRCTGSPRCSRRRQTVSSRPRVGRPAGWKTHGCVVMASAPANWKRLIMWI